MRRVTSNGEDEGKEVTEFHTDKLFFQMNWMGVPFYNKYRANTGRKLSQKSWFYFANNKLLALGKETIKGKSLLHVRPRVDDENL